MNNNISENNITINGRSNNAGIVVIGAVTMAVNNNIIDRNRMIITGNLTSATQYGIELSANASNNIITNNYINLSGYTTEYGIYLLDAVTTISWYNIIDNNSVYVYGRGLTNYGLFATTSWAYTNITNNIFRTECGTTGCQGIRMYGVADGLYMTDNIIEGNNIWTNGSTTAVGIDLERSSFNTIVRNNVIESASITTPNGITLIGTTNGETSFNTVEYNNITSTADIGATSGYGMLVSSNTNENIFRGNVFNSAIEIH
jgi:hypothetical protein